MMTRLCVTYMTTMQNYFDEMKRQSNLGRCLHFSAGPECTPIIGAHSIQRKGQLSQLADKGHVYRVEFDVGSGKLFLKKSGIKRVSVFQGFCGKHDNELFQPIDNFPLEPTTEQLALYAYRCVCREYFVKENAVRAIENIVGRADVQVGARDFLKASLQGHSIGFRTLQTHKQVFDRSLQRGSFSDFEYTVFHTCDEQPFQVSGLLYPQFDFNGRELQTLGDIESPNELITYFTAPTATGWAFCFAWHRSSDQVCKEFIKSFAAHCKGGAKPGDALLRFVTSTCENHAFKMSWWDNLEQRAQSELLRRMQLSASPVDTVLADYLMYGCENIASTEFDRVQQSWAV